ncbi:hypothetical protein AHAS_Ahas06G0013200 [Arachis hypogaea]
MVPAATVTAAFIHRFPAVLSNKQGKEKILLFSYSPAMPMRHSHSPQSTVPFGPSPFCTNLHFLFSVKAAKPDKMHPTVCRTLFDFARCHITAQNMEMEAITASLERSLQNCSLNNHSHESRREEGSVTDAEADAEAGIGISSSSDDVLNNRISNSDTTLELNSHISLPYHWEQCLDLKTGEIYYINWQNGMKAKEDPRRVAEYSSSMSRDYKSEEESWLKTAQNVVVNSSTLIDPKVALHDSHFSILPSTPSPASFFIFLFFALALSISLVSFSLPECKLLVLFIIRMKFSSFHRACIRIVPPSTGAPLNHPHLIFLFHRFPFVFFTVSKPETTRHQALICSLHTRSVSLAPLRDNSMKIDVGEAGAANNDAIFQRASTV